MYDSKKKFKGFGYLDVPIGEPLKQKCLSLDRVNFLGRPLYISEYKPKSKRAEAEFAEAEEARLKRPTVDEQVHMEMPLFRPSFVRKKPKAKLNLSE